MFIHRLRPARGNEHSHGTPASSNPSHPASAEKEKPEKGRPACDTPYTHRKHVRIGGVSCAKVLRLLGVDNPEETVEILSLMHRTRLLNNPANASLENSNDASFSEVNGFARRLPNRSPNEEEAMPCSGSAVLPVRPSQKAQSREVLHLNISVQPQPQGEGCEQSACRLSPAYCNSCTKCFRARLPIPPASNDRVLYEEAHPLPTPVSSSPKATQKLNRPDGSGVARRQSPLSGVLSSERTATLQTTPRRQPQSSKFLEIPSTNKNWETATCMQHSSESPIAGPTCQQSSQLGSPRPTFFPPPSSILPRQPVHQSPLHSPRQTVLTSGSSSSQHSPQSLRHEPQCPLAWIRGQRLGQGSFGAVYEGWNLEDGSFFAVKVSKQENASPEIQQEVAVLSQLSHPNIVQYLGSSVEDGCLCIFLELVRMGSLGSILRKYACLEEQVIRIYTRQILYGLEYLHQRNTIHRDIKCANILVDVNGQVKLADFGVAKRVDLSLASSCKGTPLYMAPEVMKSGQKRYGLLADIWSLGCTVLEMADGKPPWSNLQGFGFYFKVNGGELPPIPEHLSAEAKSFILSCLRLNPVDRPTASELLQHPFVANAPTSVPPVPWLPSSVTSPFPAIGL